MNKKISLTFSIFLGVVGLAYFDNAGEKLFILLSKSLFSPFIAGFILCAILAAALSTLDSQILTSGTILAQDIYKKTINKNASVNMIKWISRAGAIFVSLVALVISFKGSQTIYNLVKFAWSGMGSAFGPLVIASLYSKNINRYGAISGIISGAATSAIFPFINPEVTALIPGFIISFIAIYSVSYVTRATA